MCYSCCRRPGPHAPRGLPRGWPRLHLLPWQLGRARSALTASSRRTGQRRASPAQRASTAGTEVLLVVRRAGQGNLLVRHPPWAATAANQAISAARMRMAAPHVPPASLPAQVTLPTVRCARRADTATPPHARSRASSAAHQVPCRRSCRHDACACLGNTTNRSAGRFSKPGDIGHVPSGRGRSGLPCTACSSGLFSAMSGAGECYACPTGRISVRCANQTQRLHTDCA